MGLKRYKIKLLKNVSKKDLPALPKTIKLRIEEIVKERLTVNPIDLGESLRYKLKGYNAPICLDHFFQSDQIFKMNMLINTSTHI